MKMQVVNISAPFNATDISVVLQEVPSDGSSPSGAPSSMNVVVPIADASKYVAGDVFDVSLSKSTPTTKTQ